MEEIKSLMKEIIKKEIFIYGVLSNLRRKKQDSYNKVDIKPVLIKDEVKYQFTYNYDKKVLHENHNSDETIKEVDKLLKNEFRQGMIFTKEADYQILVSKKGKVNILKKKPTREYVDLSHNRKKDYIISEGKPVDFLVKLGVMTSEGKVVAKRYDKFKQINRFLELVADVIPQINKEETINIVDFGCGKSYLTFALYHYLVNILNLDVNIIGLDLKKDVISFCNEIALDLNYNRLKFIYGDIKDYKGIDKVDVVVTLHACNTATDAALIKAINWDAQVILSVPCCQHELYDKIQNPVLEPMLKHGIIRDKMASLVTDSLRGNVLEILGYQVQLLEFIDMEHTPKNILIRGIKSKGVNREKAIDEYIRFKEFWNLDDLYIERELGSKFKEIINER